MRCAESDPSGASPAADPAPVRRRRRSPPLALLLPLCAGLLATACDHTRMGCPACLEPPAAGCPFRESELTSVPDSPKLLFLSGGGSHGAWGAGVLVGWPDRPEFSVVTGISTGALQSTLAFLGSGFDDELEHLFTTTTNADVYTWKWTAPWSNSLQSREPLKQLIDQTLDDAVIRQVANVTQRELWVGTVNLDTADFCPWNLSSIARRAQDAEQNNEASKSACYYDLFRDVVWAASGAPVIAPPVPLDAQVCESNQPAPQGGALHVDGGARLRVFAEAVLLPAMTADPTAYVIVNGKLVMHPQCSEDWIGTIALRTFEIQQNEGVFGSLFFLQDELGPGSWTLQLSRVPDAACLDFPTSEFDPAKMKALFEQGKAWVQQADPWENSIPPQRVVPPPPGCPLLPGCGP